MAHKCDYEVVVDFNEDNITSWYYAKYKDKKIDVYEHVMYLDGTEEKYIRDNLRKNPMGGYLVAFPGEKETMPYYGEKIVKLGDFYQFDSKYQINLNYEFNADSFRNKLIELEPYFKFLIKKIKSNRYEIIFKYFVLAWKHKDKVSIIEWLIENNQESLVTDNNLKYNLNNNIFHFIKENKNIKNMDIRAIKLAAKENVSYKAAKRAVDYFYSDIHLEEYLHNQILKRNDISYYKDYKKMCIQLKKNFDDPYWRYPKDLVNAHNKVMGEINAIKLAKEQETIKKIQKDLSKKKNISKKYNFNDGTYTVYFPYDLEDIKEQADVLNQCLITAEYYKKYAEKKTILIFIKKESERIATCEISSKKNIRQFYMNEEDHNNCKATPELEKIMYRFLDTLPNTVRV